MKNPICAASHERMVKLEAAGCQIDFPDALPRLSFRVEELDGFVPSRVYELGKLEAGYVIAFRVGHRSSIRLPSRTGHFRPPWPDHVIDWNYKPKEIIPEEDWGDFGKLFRNGR